MIKLIQNLLQRIFMGAEALFNVAFGNRLNPLYHLGTLTFFQFWIVFISGLYLFALYDTGVEESYASMVYITETQWWLAGIMRSVHRYASDGVVITMMLHMVRHFAFDRLRGFRWFSWVSGVSLIWLVYISGINGYMLPWDKLAQFVLIGTAEWLDWLPLFNGALVRNFLFAENISGRFFTLLSFIHVAAPLVTAVLMWVHVQRVPKVQVNPPRPLMATLGITFLVLCLVKPVVSQGGIADLSHALPVVELDWFYLAVFPLFYAWPMEWVWGLLIGLSVLLTLMPWIPPKFKRASRKEFQIGVYPDNRVVMARPGESLLDAGLRAEIALPFECRNGGCGKCKCTVLYGEVDTGHVQESALSAAERAEGKVLMCCATPQSDLEIEYEPTGELAKAPIKTYSSRVRKIEKLSPDVMRIELFLPSGESLHFLAGQYINIFHVDGRRRAFSFANAPHQEGSIELHVRHIPGGAFTTHVFENMKEGDEVSFEGPVGSFHLREARDNPIIFIAGATGFAPVKSMLEQAFHHGLKRKMHLYWGVRTREDLYMGELCEQWAKEHENFSFVPVLSEPKPEDNWQGRTGFVHQAILQDFPNLSGIEIYLCGSVKMVETAVPDFLAQGASEDLCFSDAFYMTPAAKAPEAE